MNDPSWIGRASNCSKTLARNSINRLIISHFLTENEGKIGQKRAENEIKLKQNHFESSSKGGKISGGKNKKNNTLEASGIPNALAAPSPSPSPSPKKRNEYSKEYSPEFLEFWSDYPANEGTKLDAYKKYTAALNQGSSHETIIDGARRYADYANKQGKERKFIKHASTWLNQRGWETDYILESPGGIPRVNGNRDKADLAREAAERGLREMEESGFFGRQG